MPNKKIKLLAFTVLATAGVLANNISHISAPSLTAVQSAEITDQEISPVLGDTAKVVTAPQLVLPQTLAQPPQVADTTVTYVESETPAETEEVAATLPAEAILISGTVTTESVKEFEIDGQRFSSKTIDTVAPAAREPLVRKLRSFVDTPLVARTIVDKGAQQARALQIIASSTAVPVKTRSSYFGSTYLPKRPVDRPNLTPIFLFVEDALSLNQDALGTSISNRPIASFTAQKTKPIVETLVIPRPDVIGELSASTRPFGSKPVAPIAPPVARMSDLIGPLSVASRQVSAPRMPRPVFNFENVVAANSDHIGSLLIEMKLPDAPRRSYVPVAETLPVSANADNIGPLAVAAKSVERVIVPLPNWFSNEPLSSNTNLVSSEELAQRTVAPFLMAKPAPFIAPAILKNPDALGLNVAMRTLSPLAPPKPVISNSPVFANTAFIGDLAVANRPFNFAAPVKPELREVILPVTTRADVIGTLAVTDRTFGPRPTAPIAPALLAATSAPAKQMPVLIDSRIAFGRSLLSPMPVRPDDFVAEVEPVSTKGGPNENAASPIDKNIPGASLANNAIPLMIGGKTAFSSDLLKPMKPAVVVSNPLGLPLNAKANTQQQAPGYCDPNFVGEPIRFSQTVELKLEDLINQLHARFGVNFIMGPNIGKLPLNVKAGSIPWNVLLRSQLFISGVRARCIDPNTIELIENSLLPNLQDSAGVTTRFVKLKYLQRTNGGTVDSANRLQGGNQGGGGCGGSVAGGGSNGSSGGSFGGGGGNGQGGQQAGQQASSRFDRLVEEIEKVLGLRSMRSEGGGNNSAGPQTEEVRTNRSVTQIPGRNILVITATEEEHQVIDQIITLADRPPFQVLVKGLIYGANQDRLLDLGGQTTITGGNAAGDINGGIFGHTLGTPGTLFDFSAVIGTFEFNTQFTALEQKGVLSVKSRPFTTVIDGLCTMLNVGKELPIVIDNNQIGGTGDVVFVNAANNLAITPYVIDDDNGNPVAVTLELRLEANDVDSSITTRGVPAISKRSVQTQLLLGKDTTAILGGFTVDQDSKTVFKTPILGDIPILGQLFKRRVRDTRISRLYFAITASVISYPDAINPVNVPGATTDIQTITPDMKKRADEAEKTPAKKSKDN
jgi:Flp pilus assembly secretin CpaC